MTDSEPAKPARGQTADEQGRDISEAQAEVEAKASTWSRMVASMKPSFVLSMAEGYPVGVKQFLQFCLVLIYPAWVFAILVSAPIYGVMYGSLWVLFWPVRAWMKRNRPEEYAATMAKHGKG